MNTVCTIRPAHAQLALSCDSFARSVTHTPNAPRSVAQTAPSECLSTMSSRARPLQTAVPVYRAHPPDPSLFDTFPT
jgi:hypothetical protein